MNTLETFDINNRKYLGSKYRLLDFLEEKIISQTGQNINSFFDVFSGTGVVANHFRKYSKKVISNDILYSNYVINKVFLNSTKNNLNIKRIEINIKKLNNLKGKKGYCYDNFADTYFSTENTKYIDAIRECIEKLKKTKKITNQEYYVLLVSLIFAIDKIANTVGQYDAYLKNIKQKSYKNGKHLVDNNVNKKLTLKIPIINFDGVNKVYNKDSNELVKDINCDVAYLDPPYNSRQYVDCYHILENIIRWEKPKLYGKTKKFERNRLKSNYSKKVHSIYAFENLINNLKAKHIFLSYNNEGIIPDKEIKRILQEKGKLKVFSKKYNVFGNGAGNSKRRHVLERLFYCKVKKV